MNDAHNSLAGAGIVVIRPVGRGEALCRRIAAAGGDALLFPTIEIRPLPETALPETSPDWIVFASRAAVEHGAAGARAYLGPTTCIAAIGQGTATALREHGLHVDTVPEQEESEGLLALDVFRNVAGQTVWIVRGRDGRELLTDSLRARGAQVTRIEVYERRRPPHDTAVLLDWWREKRVHALVVASRAGLENLHAMLDAEGRAFLQTTQLVTPTARMLKLAHDFDIRPAPVVATGASDDALLAALRHWWRDRHQDSS